MILESWTYRVEAGKIAEFSRAVGLEPSSVAPPSFTMAAGADGIERLLARLALDKRNAVHGEQSFEPLAPIVAGMLLRAEGRVVSDVVKEGRRGGRMRVVVIETLWHDAEADRLVLIERMTVIEKDQSDAA